MSSVYVKFLKDAGGAYLSKKAFQSIISNFFSQKAKIIFSEFKNIQGRYLIAEITRNEIEAPVNRENASKNKILEFEKKFLCQNKEGLEIALLAKGFTLKETLHENDDYFTGLDGKFIEDRTCLRLRSNGMNAEITFKGKSLAFSNAYAKVEHNLPVSAGLEESYRDFLNSIGFFKYVLVEKKRRLYEKKEDGVQKNVVIDELPNISSFVEIEILADYQTFRYDQDRVVSILNNFEESFKEYLSVKADLPYRDYVGKFVADNIIKKNTLKSIIFDFDGTIIPSEELFYSSYKLAAKNNFEIDISIEDYKKCELEKDGELFGYLQTQSTAVNSVNREDFMSEVYLDYDLKLDALSLNEKVATNLEIISLLKAYGLKIGIVSTSKRCYILKILKSFDKEELFDCIIAREDVGSLKPAPDGYLLIMKELGLSSESVLAVEDSPRGIKAAKSAGLNCVGVYENSLYSKKELEDERVYPFEDISQIYLLIKFSN